jgi:endonuclease/exonuclease/phosphatase family metal-dependent hydrolase
MHLIHPGQWVAVSVGEPHDRVWVVSLYGIWETMPDNGDIFAEATLHRALSDLALLFQGRTTKRLVLAGDLNIWRGYGHKKWEPRYRTVFDRLSAYGIELAGPHRTTGLPLDGCPRKAEEACSHVRTYRHQHGKNSTPYQNDFVFTRGVQVGQCDALDEERHWEHSDHCPILLELNGL